MKKTITLIAIVFFSQRLFATIHYHYVYDYVYGTPKSYDLDLDGDDDFSFEDTSLHATNGFEVHCLKATSYFAATSTTGSDPKAYASGAGLGTYHWQTGAAVITDNYGNTGSFANTDKYLQVKFSDGTHTYYGWIELIGSNSSLAVVGYAYEDVPDQPITAGDVGGASGINELRTNLSAVTTVNASGILFKDCTGFNKVMVSTLEGKVISNINQPNASQVYPIAPNNNMVIVSYFKDEELLTSNKFVLVK